MIFFLSSAFFTCGASNFSAKAWCLLTTTIGIAKSKRVNLARQVHHDTTQSCLVPKTCCIPREIEIPLDCLYANGRSGAHGAPLIRGGQWMIDARVNRTQRGLFGHYDFICSDGHHGPSAVGLHRNNDFKFVAEHSNQIQNTPRGHAVAALRIENQTDPAAYADRIQVLNEMIKNIGRDDGFLARTISGHIENRTAFLHSFDVLQQRASFLRAHFLPLLRSHLSRGRSVKSSIQRVDRPCCLFPKSVENADESRNQFAGANWMLDWRGCAVLR